MTLGEIATVVAGTVHGDPGVRVTAPAFIDSRSPEAGGLFAAFAGEHDDGHRFARSAVEAGAAAVLGTRATGVPTVVVDDTETALGLLARHVLGRLDRVRVVALTGSQGKTSTKDLLGQLLAAAGTTVATRGSFNNEIGLPLTVLRADPDTRYLVLEMGARGIGHLRALCAIARPDVSLVLNVGKAHLGEFGSQQAIALAKGEIVDALREDGVAVLNADDPLVSAMASRSAGTVRTFGRDPDADVRLSELSLDASGRARFALTAGGVTAPVALTQLGEHQAWNALAAGAVALTCGLGVDEVAAGLSAAVATSKWRMELTERADGVSVVNDAYNANPDSVRAALEALAALGRSPGGPRRTLAVLGEMRELGESSREEHEAVGRLAVHLGIDRLLVVGEAARPIHLGASLEAARDDASVFAPDHDQALSWLSTHLVPGDVVLFKASRAAELERVAAAVLADGGPTTKETDR